MPPSRFTTDSPSRSDYEHDSSQYRYGLHAKPYYTQTSRDPTSKYTSPTVGKGHNRWNVPRRSVSTGSEERINRSRFASRPALVKPGALASSRRDAESHWGHTSGYGVPTSPPSSGSAQAQQRHPASTSRWIPRPSQPYTSAKSSLQTTPSSSAPRRRPAPTDPRLYHPPPSSSFYTDTRSRERASLSEASATRMPHVSPISRYTAPPSSSAFSARSSAPESRTSNANTTALAMEWDPNTETFRRPAPGTHHSTGGVLRRGSIYLRPRKGRVPRLPAEAHEFLKHTKLVQKSAIPAEDAARKAAAKLREEVAQMSEEDISEPPSSAWSEWMPGAKTATAVGVLGLTALGVRSYLTGMSPMQVFDETCVSGARSVCSSVASGVGSAVSSVGGYLGWGASSAATASGDVVASTVAGLTEVA